VSPPGVSADGVELPRDGYRDLSGALACEACRKHLAFDTTIIDACASVAYDNAQPVGRVVAEYLALHHAREEHS
jgi:hypothetical protein